MDSTTGPNPRQFVLASQRVLLDPLTGLPGPALLVDRVEMALIRARRQRKRVAVFVLYDAAPEPGPPVVEVAERLRAVTRPDDTVARVAGRTFVVVCNELPKDTAADGIRARLYDGADAGCRVGLALGTGADDASGLLTTAAERAAAATPKPVTPRSSTDDPRPWRRCSRPAPPAADGAGAQRGAAPPAATPRPSAA
jgi:GGDEF domain-containing protein